MKQRTILRDVSIKGRALHTGDEVQITFRPAPAGTGIIFQRTDVHGKPEIKPSIDLVDDLVRNTTLRSGHTYIHTVEHVLSAIGGMGVDNILVELNASEPPILDGSAREYVNILQEAELVEQDAERSFFEVEEPLSVSEGNRSMIVLPYDGFKITCTSADDRGVHTQHLALDIDPETYVAQLAPARTFTIYEDIEELLKLGKIQGGSLDSAIVIKGDKIISKEPLRFKDEFVRHKIMDIIGDLMLLSVPLKGHIIAVRPGHAINAKLTKALAEQRKAKLSGQKIKKRKIPTTTLLLGESALDIQRIMQIMPHRYPFVLIDRVLEIKSETELTAVKNVTINEPFFQGHFPGQPVMPGVLQLEAMAQAAGVLMLRRVDGANKVAFFMSSNQVKFRRPVIPGDQMLVKVKLTKTKGNKIAVAEGVCEVEGKIVSSAELMFTLVTRDD